MRAIVQKGSVSLINSRVAFLSNLRLDSSELVAGCLADLSRAYFFSSGSCGRCPSLQIGSDSFPLSDMSTLHSR